MPALPDVYYVSPLPEPGEYGVISFIRDTVRLVCVYAGPTARPVSVVGVASPDQGSGNPRRWTMVHLVLADGSQVVFTARPHPVVVSDNVWSVHVNRRFVDEVSPPLRDLGKRLASLAARGLRQSSSPASSWTSLGRPPDRR